MKVSIIVPVYQVEDYIGETILSISRQTYKDFDVVLVNDGSKDNSIKIAKNILEKNNIVYKIINKRNEGVSAARNSGIKEADGELIIFIDSDDVISVDYIKTLVDLLRDDYDFSFCNYKFVRFQNEKMKYENFAVENVFSKDELATMFLKRKIDFLITTMLFRKEFIVNNNLFFDESMSFSEDQKFMWQAILVSNKSVYINKQIYGYFLRPQSTMTSSSYKKIHNGYIKYSEFCDSFDDKSLGKKILARWKLGCIYTSAKLLRFDEFYNLYKEMNIRKVFFSIVGLFEMKALALSIVAFFPKLMYKVCRSIQ